MTDKSLFRTIVLDILLGLALLLYIFGSPTSPSSITMSSSDAALTRGAITLVVNEIQSGKITSYDIAIQALRSELPLNVQDEVIKQLRDSKFATLSDDMVKLAGKIQVKED